MHGDGLERRLQDLHRGSARGGGGSGLSDHHRVALQSELTARYRQRYPRHRRWLMLLSPYTRTGRFAMAMLAMAILSVGACSTSTKTQLEMGQKVSIGLTDKAASVAEIDAQLGEFFATVPGIENLNINIQEFTDGRTAFDLMIWGQDLEGEQLIADLRREIPALADAAITAEALTGTIEESLVDKWKREIFQMEVDGATEEEIRDQILAQLAEQGADDAEVEVRMEDGKTEIKVMVTEDVED
ncbi:hypothetical protein KJ682_02065 [bacterium]|nr:hypothetical protein [bacterium]